MNHTQNHKSILIIITLKPNRLVSISSSRVHSNRMDPVKHRGTDSTAPATNYILTSDKILHEIAKKEWEAAMDKEDEEEQKVYLIN